MLLISEVLPSYEAIQLTKIAKAQQETQLTWIMVAAAIVGAFVAAFASVRDSKTLPQILFSLVSGIGFGVFVGPYIGDVTGLTETKQLLFVHFVCGLLGSVFVDQIFTNGGDIATNILSKLYAAITGKEWSPKPPILHAPTSETGTGSPCSPSGRDSSSTPPT